MKELLPNLSGKRYLLNATWCLMLGWGGPHSVWRSWMEDSYRHPDCTLESLLLIKISLTCSFPTGVNLLCRSTKLRLFCSSRVYEWTQRTVDTGKKKTVSFYYKVVEFLSVWDRMSRNRSLRKCVTNEDVQNKERSSVKIHQKKILFVFPQTRVVPKYMHMLVHVPKVYEQLDINYQPEMMWWEDFEPYFYNHSFKF